MHPLFLFLYPYSTQPELWMKRVDFLWMKICEWTVLRSHWFRGQVAALPRTQPRIVTSADLGLTQTLTITHWEIHIQNTHAHTITNTNTNTNTWVTATPHPAQDSNLRLPSTITLAKTSASHIHIQNTLAHTITYTNTNTVMDNNSNK